MADRLPVQLQVFEETSPFRRVVRFEAESEKSQLRAEESCTQIGTTISLSRCSHVGLDTPSAESETENPVSNLVFPSFLIEIGISRSVAG